jgi:CheY-like chemotaxis protein
MPILDGLHATSIIRTSPPFANNSSIATIPIVAVTASSMKQDQEMFRQRGFDDILPKPICPVALKGLLEFWARSRVVLLPEPGQAGEVRRRIVTGLPPMEARGYKAKSVI